jgi:hypothetical protein
VLELANLPQGQFYGTIGQLDDTGRANYAAGLFSLQRRLKNNLSVLSSWTISKCMSDPATTEITGPTIVDPAHPDADYAYCSSDRRHLLSFSVVARTPEFSNPTLRAILRDWQFSPAVRYQSGNRSSVTTGVDNALTGLGGQRAVQVLDNPYVNGGDPTAYLNRSAFTSPLNGTYSNLAPFTIVNPANLQNDFALTRTFKIGGSQAVQFRWEVFNAINHVNFNPPVTALNSSSFGTIQTAGDPRIMQFALKFTY